MPALKGHALALGLRPLVAAAGDRHAAVAQLQHVFVEVPERGRVSQLGLQVMRGLVGGQRPVGAGGAEAGTFGLARPAVGAADRRVAREAPGAGHADLFAVVDEGRARQQQVGGGGQAVGPFVTRDLVPQAAAGELVVVGDKAGERVRRRAVEGRHAGDGFGVAARGRGQVFFQAEGKGAAAQLGLRIVPRLGGGLADHIAARVAVHAAHQLGGQAPAFGLVVPVAGVVFDQVRHGVEPKAVEPAVEPEAQAVLVVGHGRRMAQVEVGHVSPEGAQVAAGGRGKPGVLAPDVPAFGFGIAPFVPGAERAFRFTQRLRKEGVTVGAVVDHIVHDDADAAGMGLAQQLVKVGQCAVGGLDVAVVGGGVAVVAVGAAGDRHQPEAADAQLLQRVQRLREAAQVADAIAVAVLPAAHKDFHEGAVLPAFGQGTGARPLGYRRQRIGRQGEPGGRGDRGGCRRQNGGRCVGRCGGRSRHGSRRRRCSRHPQGQAACQGGLHQSGHPASRGPRPVTGCLRRLGALPGAGKAADNRLPVRPVMAGRAECFRTRVHRCAGIGETVQTRTGRRRPPCGCRCRLRGRASGCRAAVSGKPCRACGRNGSAPAGAAPA